MAVGGLSERLAFILELDPSNAISGMRRVGNEADRSLGKADDRLNRIGGRMQVAGAGAVAFAGIAGRALFSFATASEEAEGAQRRLVNSIENSPALAGESAEAFADLATEIQNVTAADGDAIVAGMALAGQLGVTGEELRNLTPLAVDLSRKMGIDMEAAFRAVGRAVQGNTGQLERMIGPMAEGESAMDALRRSVGGFAEQEGATFSGQMERLKNQLGDVAEGIGGGVVGAFSDMLGPVTAASQAFTRLDSGTQDTIGKFAAYGTAAIGVAGASSFVIGSVIKMTTNFRAAKDAVSAFAGSGGLGRIGKTGAIVAGFAALTLGAKELSDHMDKARYSLEDFARASDSELVSMIDGQVAALEGFGLSASSVYESLATESVGSLERYREALEAAGRPTEEITAAIEAEAVAQANANVTLEAGAEALGGVEGAAEGAAGAIDVATAATNAGREGLSQYRDGLEAATESNNRLLDATLARFNVDLQARQAQRDLADAIQAATVATDDSTTASDEVAAAWDRAAGQALEAAAATAAVANAQTAGGITAQQSAAIQVTELQRIANGLAPGSPLRYYLAGYINDLERTARTFTATVVTVFETQHRTTNASGDKAIPLRARGGPVTAGEPYIVGEEGPELLIPGHSGTIVPAGATNRALTSAASGGGGALISVGQVIVQTQRIDENAGAQIIAALEVAATRQGTGRLKRLVT